MTAQIKEVSENANAAEHAANQAKTNTDTGKQVNTNTINRIESLSNNIDHVMKSWQHLQLKVKILVLF